ncbi:S-adenosyl-L-methionine-dependent methyltransferase [Aspergillus avenaceus]|uniref:S-adenosyl-L-methionine-dependent methyltransferase n=1 Tax=Aspergillus avenaceus TaxID=36643 RepID=A0A5N6U813_ASPAV|nr:S-adenosyl-L-methionine-dependent methyltransferase [Aspergillus avenaceus]
MININEHKDSFHNSAYFAEYCDLWTKAYMSILDTQGDAQIYISALKDQLGSYSALEHHGEPCVVLDAGTGPGRVLVNLSNDSLQNDISLGRVEFIGVDKEPAMIHRALAAQRQTPSMSRLGRIDWLVAEAIHLTSFELLQNRIGRVDLLLFPAGGVSHLVGPDQPRNFFAQAAALLRPGSGRLYLSIRDDMISKRCITKHMESATSSGLYDRRDFASERFEGVVYKQFPVQGSRVENQIKTENYRFEAVKRTDNGEERLEESKIEVALRVWEEAELLDWFREAGLECVKTLHDCSETYYVLKRAE